MTVLYSVILAGGAGSRLWPVSRAAYPKQILHIDNNETLFYETFLRMSGVTDDKNIITTTNVKQVSAVQEQLKLLKEKFCRKTDYKILTEPIIKNTAASITMAVKYVQNQKTFSTEQPVMIVVPVDHIIPNRDEFIEIINKGIKIAQAGYIVSFSKEVSQTDENFGYLKTRNNAKIAEIEPSAMKVLSFVEKPSTKTQKEQLKKGKTYINSGIYMFCPDTFMSEMKKCASSIYKIISEAQLTDSMPTIDLNTYDKLPDISIDYALMEKTKKLVTIPFSTEWKDVGSWDAVYEISNKDKDGNVLQGKVVDLGSKNSIVYSTSKIVATLGLNDKVVVETPDAVLVCDRNNTNGIKNLYKKLNGENTAAKDIHKTVFRPWGYYTVLESGNGFLTKCIVVNPKSKLSVQLHHHRSEHWIILEGTATVIKGEEKLTLKSGDSVDIAVKEVHSLQNESDEQIKILEVQQGDILDENDIVRIEDIYGRV